MSSISLFAQMAYITLISPYNSFHLIILIYTDGLYNSYFLLQSKFSGWKHSNYTLIYLLVLLPVDQFRDLLNVLYFARYLKKD